MSMLARVRTSTLCGIDALSVDVEVQIQRGPPRFIIIGLGDGAVRESRDRVLSALQNSGFDVPEQILVNLAPAEYKKEGSGFDLPIAIGILLASRQFVPKSTPLREVSLHGELSLDGKVKSIHGVVALAAHCIQRGIKTLVVPNRNLPEARLVRGLNHIGVRSLGEAIAYLRGENIPQNDQVVSQAENSSESIPSFSEVRGQDSAKRALLIAAAGGHNVLMIVRLDVGKACLLSDSLDCSRF